MDPQDWFQHYNLGIGYEGTGRLQEAIFEYQKVIEMSAADSYGPVALAHAYSADGKRAEAAKILRDLERKLKEGVSPYARARIYAGLGENDKAFEFLEKAYSEKSFEILNLKSELQLDSLHPDPRFENLLHRIGLN